MVSTDDLSYEFDAGQSDRFRVGLTALAPPALVFCLVITLWQLVVIRTNVPAVILPSPFQVAATTIRRFPTLAMDAAITALTALLGLLASICLGIIIAFAMTYSRIATAIIHPYLISLRIAPLVAIAPLIFLWIGDGIVARALLVTSMAVFPVAIASFDGLRSTPREYLDLMESIGTPPRRVFLRVRVPAAAPSVFAGVKLASVLSVIGTVVTEFVTLKAGLGYRIFHTSAYLQTRRTFAALLVLSVVGIAFYLGPVFVEKRMWGDG